MEIHTGEGAPQLVTGRGVPYAVPGRIVLLDLVMNGGVVDTLLL